MTRFIHKRNQEKKPSIVTNKKTYTIEDDGHILLGNKEEEKNLQRPLKEQKNTNTMKTTKEKVALANSILEGVGTNKVKRLKKDRGLIERTESSKIVLTEDNKELLTD